MKRKPYLCQHYTGQRWQKSSRSSLWWFYELCRTIYRQTES